jgi:hypothetical protein
VIRGPVSAQYFAGGTNQALPQNPNRQYLMVVNVSGGTIYLGFGAPAASAEQGGLPIPAGGNYERDAEFVPTNSIFVSGASVIAQG